MKRVLALLGLSALLLGGLLLANRQRQQSALYLLSRYPQTQAFQAVGTGHLNRHLPTMLTDGFRVARVTDATFYGTWFDGPQQITVQQAVDSTGRHAAVYGGATPQQVLHLILYARLAPTRLKSLKQTLAQMPPNDPPPSLDRLLIISFQDGPKWTTRLYDRARLPAPVARIFPITTKPRNWPSGAFKP